MESPIKPTVGRKVYFFPAKQSGSRFNILDSDQPLDATILFVHSNNVVNLLVVDHMGHTSREHMVEHGSQDGDHWEWMPYQLNKEVK